MPHLQTISLQCPYCGESIEATVDCSVEQQEYVEDCAVCCRPILITAIACEGEVVSVLARSENE